MERGVYVVATPIGNLSDISARAVETLRGADLIAAEDTRHSRRLLDHLGIDTAMTALHEHNERERAETLIERVQAGEAVALISDAGTPLISDPGHTFIRYAVESGVPIVPVPGPCAITTALCASGIACSSYIFEGFLPAKSKARRDALEAAEGEARTIVYYESPHRVLETLEIMNELYPHRELAVARELTKKFETILRGTVEQILSRVIADENQQKGEFVLILSGDKSVADAPDVADQKRMLSLLLPEVPPKKAAAIASEYFGVRKKALYELAVSLKKE